MRWLQQLLLLRLTLRTLRRRRRAIHNADGVRRIRALRGGAGIFRGVRRRRLHCVGVLVLCVRLGWLWLLRPRAGRAVVYMGRVHLRMRPTPSRCVASVGDIGKRSTGGLGCAVRSKGKRGPVSCHSESVARLAASD
jgi:hypothetical protein